MAVGYEMWGPSSTRCPPNNVCTKNRFSHTEICSGVFSTGNLSWWMDIKYTLWKPKNLLMCLFNPILTKSGQILSLSPHFPETNLIITLPSMPISVK
jgi:hypothetical protein